MAHGTVSHPPEAPLWVCHSQCHIWPVICNDLTICHTANMSLLSRVVARYKCSGGQWLPWLDPFAGQFISQFMYRDCQAAIQAVSYCHHWLLSWLLHTAISQRLLSRLPLYCHQLLFRPSAMEVAQVPAHQSQVSQILLNSRVDQWLLPSATLMWGL